MREWKPGDVALVTWRNAEYGEPSRVRIRVHRGETDVPTAAERRDAWWGPDGYLTDDCVTEVRPLVVIDPENPEDVARLTAAWESVDSAPPGPVPMTMRQMRMQAALRSLGEAPRPAEPTGLGAVVEDRDGRRWVRVEAPDDETRPWYSGVNDGYIWRHWPQIAAVRKLSEGVTAP